MSENFNEKKITRSEYSRKNFGNYKWWKKNMSKLIKYIIVLIIVVWIYVYISYSNFKTGILVKKEIVVEVEKWDTVEKISEKLDINKNYLKIYLKYNKPDFELIAWKFKIKDNSNIEIILKWLNTPIIAGETDITILEWWNIYDIDDYLASKDLINSEEYINYVTDLEKIEKLTEFFPFIKWLETLEWFLYPDTYTVVSDNFKINEFVIKQLENFENKVYKTILSDIDNKKIENLINLSSIVEKEEKSASAKPIVAWILKKRLDEWWMLWADITVCYPHKLTADQCKLVISKYIKEESEYNTRTMKWLPKTPIWNPSYETINATLNLEETEYWFYLHDTDSWKIYYATDNAEHEQNKRLYLK